MLPSNNIRRFVYDILPELESRWREVPILYPPPEYSNTVAWSAPRRSLQTWWRPEQGQRKAACSGAITVQRSVDVAWASPGQSLHIVPTPVEHSSTARCVVEVVVISYRTPRCVVCRYHVRWHEIATLHRELETGSTRRPISEALDKLGQVMLGMD